MSTYKEDSSVREYIDERMKEINEVIYPKISGTDCSFEEYKLGVKRERTLLLEIKQKDKDFFLDIF